MNATRHRAFTLTELLVGLTVILFLAALLIPAAQSVFASSTGATSAHCISQLNAAAQSYLAENNMTFWPYRVSTNGGTQWWFGFESTASMSAPEGKRWLDLNQGPLGPYIAASGGMSKDPSFARAGNTYKPKYGSTHFAYGYNLLLQRKNQLALVRSGKTPVFATCAQVNTFQAPASARKPMVEEFYYFNTTERTVHFRVGGQAMVGYADGSAGYLPMMAGTLDSRMPGANIGRLDPSLITPQ
ncbi:MAG: type II secretion system GspH family protein [Verrucomicrobia bacterium]|nr:type II secretion system GspH family protein [Verrucomicrobiota bacterium]